MSELWQAPWANQNYKHSYSGEYAFVCSGSGEIEFCENGMIHIDAGQRLRTSGERTRYGWARGTLKDGELQLFPYFSSEVWGYNPRPADENDGYISKTAAKAIVDEFLRSGNYNVDNVWCEFLNVSELNADPEEAAKVLNRVRKAAV